MSYHILNGDSLFHQLLETGIEGAYLICRECLIDGPLYGEKLTEFYDNRAAYIERIFDEKPEKYYEYVVPQFQQIEAIHPNDPVFLWFGDDLFCFINLCFVVHLLDRHRHRQNNFVIKAQLNDWQEFGSMSPSELRTAYQNRQPLSASDFRLLLDCWQGFSNQNLPQLAHLATQQTTNFPKLYEVIQAHIDRFPIDGSVGRPQRSLQILKKQLNTDDFNKIFRAFCIQEGVYGFGDSQVRQLLNSLEKG